MESTDEKRWGRRRHISLAFIYIVFFGTGMLNAFLMNIPAGRVDPAFAARTAVLTGILFGLGFLWFCTADARLLGRPLIEMARLGIFIAWPLAVPLYMIWARGIRGLGLLLLHGVGLLLVGSVPMAVMMYLQGNS